MKLKSHFIYDRQQRKEIVLLLLVIVAGVLVYNLISFSTEDVLDVSSPHILALQKEIDSLKEAKKKNSTKIYPFNPNYITDFKGYTLGMSIEEIDRLHDFRTRDQWINSAAQFQEVTGISDSLLAVISPYFKFPDWVQSRKDNKPSSKTSDEKERPLKDKIDLNLATAEELQKVRGIGKVLSERIINYRNQLGGFSDDNQLLDVYGLEPEVVQRTLQIFTVKTPKEIIKININKASASDLATIPGVSYELARKMWEYRKLRGRIDSISEIKKVPGISEARFSQIRLYLSLD